MKVSSPEAYRLMHEGALALADVEANGIRIDVGLLDSKIKRTTKRITNLRNKLREQDIWKEWKKQFGTKAKLGSRDQLSFVLFDCLGYEYPLDEEPRVDSRTKRKKYKGDEEVLASVKHVFVKNYLKLTKLEKMNGTYLKGIRKHVAPDGFLRPGFNLHIAETWRSSSSDPNFQNIPVRNPEVGREIREVFVARDEDHVLVEIDYSGIEVRIAACYHKDPVMMEYINDESKDMHRDMAAECYKCQPDQVSKGMRYCGKNQFVFPQFYGDFYVDCARVLWDSVRKMKLELNDGTPVFDWLKKQGIKRVGELDPEQKPRPGTFEKHIQDVEHDFWKRRFKVYDKWKDRWWKAYQENGYFQMKTGFVARGIYRRNQVINSPVQGAAFHCLLKSLIKLNKWVKKNLKRSYLVGQIHDSILADVHVKELDKYLKKANKIMTKDLVRDWDWIVVPIEIEAEVTPPGGNWYQKEEIKL